MVNEVCPAIGNRNFLAPPVPQRVSKWFNLSGAIIIDRTEILQHGEVCTKPQDWDQGKALPSLLGEVM